MNRSEAREFWQVVANGGLESEQDGPVDYHRWIRTVASAILEADSLSAGRRAGGIVRAVGLNSKLDGYAELRAFVQEDLWDFWDLDTKPSIVLRQMLEEARQRGLLTGNYAVDDKAATDLLRRLRRGQL